MSTTPPEVLTIKYIAVWNAETDTLIKLMNYKFTKNISYSHMTQLISSLIKSNWPIFLFGFQFFLKQFWEVRKLKFIRQVMTLIF